MIKIIICGAAGRMGREIINAAQSSDDIEIVAGIEAQGNKYVASVISNVHITDDILSVINNVDCVVDFTNHKATIDNLQKIKDLKNPHVIGTTGFSDSEYQEIVARSEEFPIFLAPNMSIGVNHLYNLVQSSVEILEDYDIEVIETHHKGKKDAPSGTAKAIAKVINDAKKGTRFIYGREGMIGARKKGEVCINSVRGGDVVGEHRVLFLGDGEFLELRHYATSRRCFAAGTLEAVRYILRKPPGMYSMKDLLKK
jgi:4-hydroxy-tetrahydrodipicolinate reductase